MVTIISIILIVISILIIIAIIIKKLPALAILDVENMPEEKESKFKDAIIKSRVERDFAKVGGVFGRFFLKLKSYLSKITNRAQENLKKMKLSQKVAEKLPHQKKEKRIKDLIMETEKLIKDEEYTAAEKNLVEIISLDQKNLWAFYELGEVYEELRKYPEARQTFEYSLKLAKQEQKDEVENISILPQEVYFSLALLERKAGNIDAAYDNTQEALEIESNNPRFLDLILDLSIIKNDKPAARAYLQKLAEVNPENKKLEERREQVEKIEELEEENYTE